MRARSGSIRTTCAGRSAAPGNSPMSSLGPSRACAGWWTKSFSWRTAARPPLDYKFAEYKDRVFANHRFQLAFYGRLIQENLNKEVHLGYIVYTRSRNKLVEVELAPELYTRLDGVIQDFLEVVQKGKYPPPTRSKARCADCCYGNLCEKVI